MFVVLLTVLNFYKSVMKRDKEMHNNRQAELMKRKAEEQLIQAEQSAHEAKLLPSAGKNQYVIDGMLEYDKICLELHGLMFRPNYDKSLYGNDDANHNSSTTDTDCDDVREQKINYSKTSSSSASSSSSSSVNKRPRHCECTKRNCGEVVVSSNSNVDTCCGSGTVAGRHAGGKLIDKPMMSDGNSVSGNSNNKTNSGGESSSLIYVFVLVLLVSLIKAAFDISKQIKEVSQS